MVGFRRPAHERYQNDPVFRNLVMSFMVAIENADFTPSEIREAAMFAQILYEETHIRPILLEMSRMWPPDTQIKPRT